MEKETKLRPLPAQLWGGLGLNCRSGRGKPKSQTRFALHVVDEPSLRVRLCSLISYVDNSEVCRLASQSLIESVQTLK